MNNVYNVTTMAHEYAEKGYSPVPVQYQTKMPIQKSWQALRIVPDQIESFFPNTHINVGVVLGAASKGLIDIDFDNPAAIRFASHFLPSTDAVFGRDSNPCSHWLYQVPDPRPRKAFRTKNGMILEVRGNGSMTVFPGSIHESGEYVAFERNGDPASTSFMVLEEGARKVAIATVFFDFWTEGNRHDLTLALAGFLGTRGWTQEDVEYLVQAIVQEAGDTELNDRLIAVETTFANIAAGRTIAYNSTLEAILGRDSCKAVESWVPSLNKMKPVSPVQSNISFDMLSDAGLADAFVEANRGDLIWAIGDNNWYRRNNQIFEKSDPVKVQGLAKNFLQTATQSLGPYAKSALTRSKIDSSVALSRSSLCKDAKDFDTDRMLLGLEDGSILDLSKQELMTSPTSIVTKRLGVNLEPSARCPNWENFLNRIFQGDETLIRFLQRAVGYSLTGEVSEQALFILIGKGANGKSTFLKILQSLFGDYSTVIPMQTLMENAATAHQTNDLASLAGKRFVVASEGEQNQKLAESKIKLMTGGDRIKCRHLYQDFFEFDPTFKLWLATNSFPSASGSDDAIWRRMRVVQFPVSIPAHQQDPDLSNKLLKELPGIFNWALSGLVDWQTSGMQTPDQVRASTRIYRDENDVIGQWIESCCFTTFKDAKTPAKELHGSYANWCSNSGFEPMSSSNFGKDLTRRGFSTHKTKDGNVRGGIMIK